MIIAENNNHMIKKKNDQKRDISGNLVLLIDI